MAGTERRAVQQVDLETLERLAVGFEARARAHDFTVQAQEGRERAAAIRALLADYSDTLAAATIEAREADAAREESKRLRDGWQQCDRERRETFEQSCRNLQRAEAAEALLRAVAKAAGQVAGEVDIESLPGAVEALFDAVSAAEARESEAQGAYRAVLADNERLKREAEQARAAVAYAGSELLRSDFRCAAEMRAALEQARAELETGANVMRLLLAARVRDEAEARALREVLEGLIGDARDCPETRAARASAQPEPGTCKTCGRGPGVAVTADGQCRYCARVRLR